MSERQKSDLYFDEGPGFMRKVTIIILVTVSVILIAWDVTAYLTEGGKATISVVMLGFAQEHPVVPFLIGVLCGHILWPLRAKK